MKWNEIELNQCERGLSFSFFLFHHLCPILKKKSRRCAIVSHRFVQPCVVFDFLAISDDRVNSLIKKRRGWWDGTFLIPVDLDDIYADERILPRHFSTLPRHVPPIHRKHAGNDSFLFIVGRRKKIVNDFRRAMPITIQFFSRHFHHPPFPYALHYLSCFVWWSHHTRPEMSQIIKKKKEEMKSHGAWLAPCRF
jgi:hypothetical protein